MLITLIIGVKFNTLRPLSTTAAGYAELHVVSPAGAGCMGGQEIQWINVAGDVTYLNACDGLPFTMCLFSRHISFHDTCMKLGYMINS